MNWPMDSALAPVLGRTLCPECNESVGVVGNKNREDPMIANHYRKKFRCPGSGRRTAMPKKTRTEDELEELVEQWHDGDDTRPLIEFLGMTPQEYQLFLNAEKDEYEVR